MGERPVSGMLNVPELKLGKDDVYRCMNSFEVVAQGDIDIAGSIVPSPVDNGASITLRSKRGSITIQGAVRSGFGAHGNPTNGQGTVIAGDGKPGGDVTLESEAGNVTIDKDGEVTAGDGGEGGDANASGPGSPVKAQSGRGGNGGNVTITARRSIKVLGKVKGGDGRPGGRATAEGGSGSGELARPSGNVEAEAHLGGDGGDITVQLSSTNQGTIELEPQELHGGKGGDTKRAKASGGVNTKAEAMKAGRGGNVTIKFTPPKQELKGGGANVRAGNGGNCGEKPDEPPQADAEGTDTAEAKTSDGVKAAGGEAGKVSGVQAPDAEAGDSGASKAVKPGREDVKPGSAHSGTTPGKAGLAVV